MRDVAVIGAGPVGATLAALLAGSGLDVAVYEARSAPSTQDRILALSEASRAILADAGAWPRPAAAITSIHISQKGGPGRTLLEAAEQSLPALGYTVSHGALEHALAARLKAAGIPIIYGASCSAISLREEHAAIRFASGDEVHARLLVLADGGANASRIPGIAFTEKDYEQHAVIGLVTTDRPHGDRAYERFTPQGPVALLPVESGYAFVWTATPGEAQRLLAQDDAPFLSGMQAHFGDRAGRFVSVAKRMTFPLRLRAVNVPVALRTAIVGNAAQALHPIAGQGLNLGLRDAASLAAFVAGTPRERLGDAAMLDGYRGSRRRDADRGVAFTDFLVSAFAQGSRIPRWGRGLALTALDLIPPARRALARRMISGASR